MNKVKQLLPDRLKCLPVLALILSVLFWVIDSIIDTLVFDEGESIIENIISPEPIELWMRTLVVTLFLSFSFYSKYLLGLQKETANELAKHREELEEVIIKRTYQLQSEIEIRKKAEKRLKAIATTDHLTQLYNRHKFSEILQFEISRERRNGIGLSLILCDIDKFKKVNDTYGHIQGDNILKSFSEVVKTSIRETDIVARWGGEEFVILIVNSDIQRASKLANKLQMLIENTKFKGVKGGITASFGVSKYEKGDTEQSFINRADIAMYKAKQNGRNCVEVNRDNNYLPYSRYLSSTTQASKKTLTNFV